MASSILTNFSGTYIESSILADVTVASDSLNIDIAKW